MKQLCKTGLLTNDKQLNYLNEGFNPQVFNNALQHKPDIAELNKSAHRTLLEMMENQQIITIYGDISKEGYQMLRIESNKMAKFPYYTNNGSLMMVINYLRTGVCFNVENVNPCDLVKSDFANKEDYRKQLLSSIIGQQPRLGTTQVTPLFCSGGRIRAITKFPYGMIHHFMEYDQTIVDLLRDHGYLI